MPARDGVVMKSPLFRSQPLYESFMGGSFRLLSPKSIDAVKAHLAPGASFFAPPRRDTSVPGDHLWSMTGPEGHERRVEKPVPAEAMRKRVFGSSAHRPRVSASAAHPWSGSLCGRSVFRRRSFRAARSGARVRDWAAAIPAIQAKAKPLAGTYILKSTKLWRRIAVMAARQAMAR